MRIVERKALLEALAGQLPEGTIRFNSRVTSIKKPQTSSSPFTDLELQDGSTYSAKVGHFTNSFQSIGSDNFVQSMSTPGPNLVYIDFEAPCPTLNLNSDSFKRKFKFQLVRQPCILYSAISEL